MATVVYTLWAQNVYGTGHSGQEHLDGAIVIWGCIFSHVWPFYEWAVSNLEP